MSVGPRVEPGELVPVAALDDRVGCQGPVAGLDPVEPVQDVPVPHGLPELAVVDDVDPGVRLAPHHVRDPVPQLLEDRRRPLAVGGHGFRQLRRSLQGPDMGGEDPLSASPHPLSPVNWYL
jgi:hypothetical protein